MPKLFELVWCCLFCWLFGKGGCFSTSLEKEDFNTPLGKGCLNTSLGKEVFSTMAKRLRGWQLEIETVRTKQAKAGKALEKAEGCVAESVLANKLFFYGQGDPKCNIDQGAGRLCNTGWRATYRFSGKRTNRELGSPARQCAQANPQPLLFNVQLAASC